MIKIIEPDLNARCIFCDVITKMGHEDPSWTNSQITITYYHIFGRYIRQNLCISVLAICVFDFWVCSKICCVLGVLRYIIAH